MAKSIPPEFLQAETVFCPVPLSPERKRERGYNPAEILCLHLSGMMGIPNENLLKKVKSIPPQMSLTRKERLLNPEGAYETLRTKAIPFRVILVDDVFTTGATLEECAKILKLAGCRWVGAVLWGRTPRYF
jgi:ComF family protein